MVRRLLGMAAAALALTGCVSGPYTVYPLGQTSELGAAFKADLAASAEDTIRTAKSGEILFEQPISYARLMVLENTIQPAKNLDNSLQSREVTFNEGDVYFQAIDAADQLNLVACSTHEPVKLTRYLAKDTPTYLKLCFVLEPLSGDVKLNDIKTDRESFSSSQFFFVTAPSSFNDFGAPYQALTYWPIDHILETTEPARFKLLDADADASEKPTTVAVRFLKDGGKYSLEPVYSTGQASSVMRHEPVLIDPSETFPKTVKLQEAEIELLALTDDTLAYRILSGFSPDRTYILDLPE